MSLRPVDLASVDAIPVTTPARTLLDIATCAPPGIVEEALDDALRRGLLTLRRLQWRLDELGPRPGSGVIVDLLAARPGGRAVPQSVFETRLLRTLREAGLPIPVAQHEVRTGSGQALIDFAYVDERVGIEADGFRWHSSRRQWDHDRARSNALTTLGWTIVRVTWTELHDRPGDVIETIRAVLDRST